MSLRAAALTALGVAIVLSGTARADEARPAFKGRHKIKVDSSPQQAAVYWAVGAGTPKSYGIAGYTPITIKMPKGGVKIVVELAGWKPQEKTLDLKKSQTVTFTLERAPQPAKLDLQSTTDGSATGADVKIDGVSRGTIPNAFELIAGRHQVEITKAGYKPWNDWFDLTEGERRTRDVSLTKTEAPAGALLVTSDAGGEVYVDGVRKDVAPAIITGVPAGDHVIEVRKDGVQPWRQNVTVPSGQQVKVNAIFGAAVGTASLRVIASEQDAVIFVDGEDKGRSPANVANLKAGEHVVEARKPKFKPVQQTVRVAAGESSVVQLKLEIAPPDRPHATLKVQSTVPNAEVFVDGSSLGRAPIDRNDLDPGKHYVVVHKDGFTDFKREVILIENQAVNLVADLSATGSIRILSTPEGADLRIDGELIGKTPVSRDGIGSGDHIVEFRLKGYFDHKENMKIEGGREKVFSVDLKQLPTGPTPEQMHRRKTAMSSFGARTNPTGGVTADFGGGYPYFFMTRLLVGAFNLKPPLGLDMGVEFKTYFTMYELSMMGRLQLVEAGPFGLATRLNLGGGAGPNGRDTYFMDITGIASLAFSDVATVSGSVRFSGWTDRFCPSQVQRSNGVNPEQYCDAANWPGIFDKDPNGNRFSGKRFYIGIGVTAALDRYMSVFLQLEFLPAPDTLSPKPREAFLDKVNGAMFDKDTFFYGNAGVSLKF